MYIIYVYYICILYMYQIFRQDCWLHVWINLILPGSFCDYWWPDFFIFLRWIGIKNPLVIQYFYFEGFPIYMPIYRGFPSHVQLPEGKKNFGLWQCSKLATNPISWRSVQLMRTWLHQPQLYRKTMGKMMKLYVWIWLTLFYRGDHYIQIVND